MQGAMPEADTSHCRIGALRGDQVKAVARIHVRGDRSFLASLGAEVLAHYYRTFLDYPQACALVARQVPSGTVVGFVVGTEDLRRHYRTFLLRRLLPMLPSLLVRALTDRRVALGLLRRAGRVAGIAGRRSRGDTRAAPMPAAHLMMVVVLPPHRGRGIGEILVRAFTAEMTRRGVPRLVLGVRDDNHTARRLYERLGWRPAVREAGDSWLYLLDLHGRRCS
jgi:ribosomal protein S18 acetylase RimI-like enzyme